MESLQRKVVKGNDFLGVKRLYFDALRLSETKFESEKPSFSRYLLSKLFKAEWGTAITEYLHTVYIGNGNKETNKFIIDMKIT